jgi:hypothetical protein
LGEDQPGGDEGGAGVGPDGSCGYGGGGFGYGGAFGSFGSGTGSLGGGVVGSYG